MKLLKCLLCNGEADIIGNEFAVNKIIRCQRCGYSNNTPKKEPEVVIIKKRII